jgi:hypothetical protein
MVSFVTDFGQVVREPIDGSALSFAHSPGQVRKLVGRVHEGRLEHEVALGFALGPPFILARTHSLSDATDLAISPCAVPPGLKLLIPPASLVKNGRPPAREYCSFGGRLKSMSASSRVPLGWCIATSSWLTCALTWWREI